jgi:pimeloyl-ACP methyl ester carboxylesterase
LTSSDGEPVAVHDFGGQGPALVLGHGNGLNAGMWAAALPHLRALGFHCYGIDLRGHGTCRPIDPSYPVTRDRFAGDVVRAVTAIASSPGDGPVAYAGHSLGGVAGILASLHRPDLFTALWVFEPVLVPDGFRASGGGSQARLVEAARRRRMEFDSVDDAVHRLGSKPPFDRCDPVAVRGYLEIGTRPVAGGVRLTCSSDDEARVFGSDETFDLSRLAALESPVTVARGAGGDQVHALPADLAPVVAAAIPGARLERHPAMSHFGPMEDGETTARSIARAVRSHHLRQPRR